MNGIELRYAVQGHGQPLVLIMGLGGPQQAWYFQVRAFRRHYQVITFGNRGTGRTRDGGRPFTVRTMAGDTVGLLDHLGIEQAHVCTLDRLHEIQAPTLVLTGTADRVLPPQASDELAARIPGSRLVQIEGASHALAIERREPFHRHVLEFLEEVSGEGRAARGESAAR